MADSKDARRMIKEYGGYREEESSVVFDSRNAGFRNPSASKETSAAAQKAAEILNKTNQHSEHIKTNLGIWREVRPGYRANTSGQAAIEGMRHLQGMTDGDDLIVYDTEILGTTKEARKTKANLGFYSPTEIGFQHVKMVNGKLQEQNKSLSMLLRPTKDNYTNLDNLITKANTGGWIGMSPDERRTLSDLVLYSGDAGRLFTTEDKNGRKITTVNAQNRDSHPMKGSVLGGSDSIALMKQGLQNLQKYGTSPEDAIQEMNSFMSGMSKVRMGGYNVFSFDQPMMMDYLNNQVGKDVEDSKVGQALQRMKEVMSLQQVDVFHASRTLQRSPYTQYGKNMRLESTMDESAGQAHHALSDVGATIKEMNRLLETKGVKRVLRRGGGVPGSEFGSFDDTPLQVGDRLFGRKGMNTREAGEYDGVFRNQDNALTPAYDIRVNPLYRNATYEVKKFFDKVDIDGKQMFGVQLWNEKDDLHHVIMRESEAALQDAIHGHLDFLEPGEQRKADRAVQMEDRAGRRYRKMFSMENGGGTELARRIYQGLSVIQKGEADGLSEDKIRSQVVGLHDYNTDELFRDIQTMRPRLEAEKSWIESFLSDVEASYPAKAGTESTYQMRSRDKAFHEFGKLLDEEAGRNERVRSFTNGEVGLSLKTAQGTDKVLRIGADADAVRQSLYGHLYDKHAGRPHMADMRKDFRDLLMQLKSYNALSAKKFEAMYNGIGQYRQGESIDTLLSELANEVVRARETNSMNGALSGISVEDPTRLHGTRKERLANPDFFGEVYQGLKTKALERTRAYSNSWDGKDHNPIPLTGRAAQLIEQHDAAIQTILNRNNIDKARVSTELAQSSKKSLAKVVNAYASRGMDVQIRHNAKTDTLQMVLALQGSDNDSLLNSSMEDIRKSNRTAVVDLPKMNADGTISLGGQNRVARLKAQKRFGGGYEVITGFEEIMGTLSGDAKVAQEMLQKSTALGEKNGMIRVESHLNKRALKGIQSLSANNRYGNPSDKESMFEVRSQAANWVRTGHVDISDTAESWYAQWYDKQSEERKKVLRLKTVDEIKEKAKGNKDTFVNEMGSNAKNIFHREIDDYLEAETGMKLGMHSAKDTHVSNFIRSNLDTRDLLAFGNFSPMARENLMKTVNYLSIDRQETEAKLRQGGYSEGKVQRMTKRGVMSTTAANVMEEMITADRLSFLNMRVAYMTDEQLAGRVDTVRGKYEGLLAEEQQKASGADKQLMASYEDKIKALNSERFSVYDGMMVMSDQAGAALGTHREKRIKLKPGAEFTPEIKAMLDRASGGTFDPSEDKAFTSLKLSQAMDTSKAKPGEKLTVSTIVKEQLEGLDADENPIMKKQHITSETLDIWKLDRLELGSWNAEEQTLVLKEKADFGNSTKVVSEGGLRGTATSADHGLIKEIVGAEADAIVPAFEPGKKLYGTEVQRLVGFAVDEAMAQIEEGKRTTVGQLSKDDALRRIQIMMEETFQMKDGMSRIGDNQILIDSKLGHGKDDMVWDYADMGRFSNRLKDELGIEPEVQLPDGQKVALGNLGIARHDVHDWENGIGLSEDGRAGLTKYGRKEIDMVSTRANQVLNKTSHLGTWLQKHVSELAAVQSPDIERVASGLFRVASEDSTFAPREGDVVIKTRSDMGNDPNRIRDGVREISMHEVNALPEATVKGTKFVSDHYAGSIIDPQGMRGKFSDGTSYGDAISKNDASMLIEMPDETFARDYLRTVDFGDITKGGTVDTPMMRDLQKTQMQIWRGIKEYQAFGEAGEAVSKEDVDKVRGRVNELMFEYEDKAARMVTNARDNGLMKNLGSAKMSMSGRFRIQGVNPFGNYEQDPEGNWGQKADAKYKEGVSYMSRSRVAEMIQGSEEQIAKVMGLEMKEGMDLTKEVLDNVNEKGLYGLVNRYPTIKQSTIQAMKIEIDDDMADNDRGARLTVGTAARLKADFDGDFMSAMLAHYGVENEKDAGTLHSEMKQLFEAEQQASIYEGRNVMKGIDEDVQNLAKTMNITAGDLAKQVDDLRILGSNQWDDKQASFMNLFNNQITSRLREADEVETREARLGKEFVGRIDNTRDKVVTLATATLDVLEKEQRINGETSRLYRNTIEDTMATFSQELISSKKFDIDAEIKRQLTLDPSLEGQPGMAEEIAKQTVNERYTKVLEMNEAMLNPTQANLDLFRENNREIGLFQGEEKLGKMEDALSRIRDVAVWNGRADGYNNISLKMGISEGVDARNTREFLNARGGHFVETPMTRFMAEHATDEGKQVMTEGFSRWKQNVVAGFDDSAVNQSSGIADTLVESSFNQHSLDGATMSERSGSSLRGVAAQFMPSGGGGAAGIMGGAVAFGALWATSALVRSGPTPEGLREQTEAPAAPVAPSTLAPPTARITENNGEHINIRIAAKGIEGMSEQDVSALVHQEISAMSTVNMNTTMNVNDNTQNIDQQWLQGIIANAVNKGIGF